MRATFHLGKIAGVDVGIHYSMFAMVALVSWSLADGFLPQRYPGWSTQAYWGTGVLSALLLFTSVLVHELAHSVVARLRNFPVEGITLFILGGVTNMTADARRPMDELAISIVGPLTSLAVAAAFWTALLTSSANDSPARFVVWYLAFINLVVAVFNMLPAFPLDGGRVLRSIVWAVTGSVEKATRVATRGGQIAGLVLIGVGVLEILTGYFLGVMTAIVGWFLFSAATSSRRDTSVQADFAGARVRDVMDTGPASITADVTLAEAVFGHFLRFGAASLPVLDEGRVVGIITLADVRGVPRERWDYMTVRDKMTRAPLWSVGPDDDVLYAMTLLGEHSVHQVPVVDGGRLVGMLSRAHVVRYIHARRQQTVE